MPGSCQPYQPTQVHPVGAQAPVLHPHAAVLRPLKLALLADMVQQGPGGFVAAARGPLGGRGLGLQLVHRPEHAPGGPQGGLQLINHLR